MNSTQVTQKLIDIIDQFDTKGKSNEYRNIVIRAVREAVSNQTALNLACFTCSTINSEHLFSNKPWLYVSTNPAGNNLEPDIKRLQTIMKKLASVYPLVRLIIFIGNTDPYYIYLQQFRGFSPQEQIKIWQKFGVRWRTYKKNLDLWIREATPELKFELVSWYELEKGIERKTGKSFEKQYEQTMASIDEYVTKDQLDWEYRKLQIQFGLKGYFQKLQKPSDAILRDWIVRKFTEYAVQAVWIYEQAPNAILIQNEKPSELRSQMYQPLINEKYKTFLPIVYFFGVNNVGYQ